MTDPSPLSKPGWRFAISVLIVGHLMALVLPPLSFQARGSAGQSPSVAAALWPVRHYAEFIHTDRGYAFFAPDPGPSHLIQVVIRDGETESTRMIPDLSQQWPRLLYHRHFMLAEYFNALHQPPVDPRAEADEAQALKSQRDRFVRMWESIHRHLETVHQNDSASKPEILTRRIQHVVPNYAAYVREPIELDDPRLFRVLLDAPAVAGGSDVQPLLAPVDTSAAEDVPPPDGVTTPPTKSSSVNPEPASP